MKTKSQILLGTCADRWIRYMKTIGFAPNTIHSYGGHVKAFLKKEKLTRKTVHASSNLTERISRFVNNVGFKRTSKVMPLAALRSYFDWIVASGFIERNPALRVRVTKALTHKQKELRPVLLFTSKDIDRLLATFAKRIEKAYLRNSTAIKDLHYNWDRVAEREKACAMAIYRNEFNICAVLLAYHFGLRLNDILTLEHSAFENPKEFVVWTLKRNTRISFPLKAEGISLRLKDNPEFAFYDNAARTRIRQELNKLADVMDYIKCLLPEGKGNYVWPYMARRDKNDLLVMGRRLSGNFSEACTALGLKGHTFHMLRHTRARRWRAIGLDLNTIASLLGHNSTNSTKHYTNES